MPSPTLTPDPPVTPERPDGPHRPTLPEAPASAEPAAPTSAEPTATAEAPAEASAEAPALAELARLRLVRVPDVWPPYDCDIHGTACPATREATQANPPVSGRTQELADPQADGLAPTAVLRQNRDSLPGTAPPAASPAAASINAASMNAAWPRQFAQVIVEILAGSRSPRQLVPLTTDRVRAQIGLLARSLACDQRPRIKRVVAFRPAAGVVEMTVVVSFGPRSRALAMRFEHRPARPAAPGLPARPARWLCTDLEAG